MGLRTLSLVGLARFVANLAIAHSGPPEVNAYPAGPAILRMLFGVYFIGSEALLHVGKGDSEQVHGHATALLRKS